MVHLTAQLKLITIINSGLIRLTFYLLVRGGTLVALFLITDLHSFILKRPTSIGTLTVSVL
jgi:hypothetical protein